MSPWAKRRKARRRIEFQDFTAVPRYWLYLAAGGAWLLLMLAFFFLRALSSGSAGPLVGD